MVSAIPAPANPLDAKHRTLLTSFRHLMKPHEQLAARWLVEEWDGSSGRVPRWLASAIQPDPIYRETVVRHARPRMVGEKFDPQETDPKLRATFAAADAAAERRVGNVKRDSRFVFRFWSEKKKILRQKYNIDWKTPAELNPHVAYASYGEPQITQREVSGIRPVIRRRTRRPIATIDRDFEGEVTVRMKPDGNEATTYLVRKHGHVWKIVAEGREAFE